MWKTPTKPTPQRRNKNKKKVITSTNPVRENPNPVHKKNKPKTPTTQKNLYSFYYLPIQKEEKISPKRSSDERGLVICPSAN